MVMHEEGPPVGYEGWIFVPFLSVQLVFPSLLFIWVLSSRRLARRGRAHYDRSRRFGRWRFTLLEVELLHWAGLALEGQSVPHEVSVVHSRGMGRLGCRRRASIWDSLLPLGPCFCCPITVVRLPQIGRCRRCLINIARIAIIRHVLLVTDGAFGHGIIVDVKCIEALIFGFILHPAAVANDSFASRDGSCHRVDNEGCRCTKSVNVSSTSWKSCDSAVDNLYSSYGGVDAGWIAQFVPWLFSPPVWSGWERNRPAVAEETSAKCCNNKHKRLESKKTQSRTTVNERRSRFALGRQPRNSVAGSGSDKSRRKVKSFREKISPLAEESRMEEMDEVRRWRRWMCAESWLCWSGSVPQIWKARIPNHASHRAHPCHSWVVDCVRSLVMVGHYSLASAGGGCSCKYLTVCTVRATVLYEL